MVRETLKPCIVCDVLGTKSLVLSLVPSSHWYLHPSHNSLFIHPMNNYWLPILVVNCNCQCYQVLSHRWNKNLGVLEGDSREAYLRWEDLQWMWIALSLGWGPDGIRWRWMEHQHLPVSDSWRGGWSVASRLTLLLSRSLRHDRLTLWLWARIAPPASSVLPGVLWEQREN